MLSSCDRATRLLSVMVKVTESTLSAESGCKRRLLGSKFCSRTLARKLRMDVFFRSSTKASICRDFRRIRKSSSCSTVKITKMLKQAGAEEGEVLVLPIGKRSAEYFVHHEVPLFTQEVLLAADVSVGECFQLSRQITEGYLKGEYDAVKICYTRFDSMMTQTAATMEVLPLSIEPTEQQKADARRSQIYNALFEIRGGKPVRLCEDRAISLAELGEELGKMQKSAFLVGDGARLCYNTCLDMGIPAVLAPGNLVSQSAWGVAMAAFGQTPVPAEELLPVYLRLSQAERERQARLAAQAAQE